MVCGNIIELKMLIDESHA